MGIGWVILLIVPYVHALIGVHRPRVDRAVIAYGVAHSVLLTAVAVADPAALDRYWRYVWDPLLLPIGLYPTFLMLRSAARSRDLASSFVLASGLIVLVLAIHDLLVLVGVLPREQGFLFHYGAVPVIAVFGSILLLRFVDGMRQVEILNRHLEERVSEKTAEIEQGYRLVQRAARRSARAARSARASCARCTTGSADSSSRPSRCSSRVSVDASTVEAGLRDALDEMRLTVDTFGAGTSRDAVTALAMLRQRLQPRLEAAGLRVVWRVAHDVPLPALGAESTLDLLRIVQEALSNVLKHAQRAHRRGRDRRAPPTPACASPSATTAAASRPGRATGHGLANMRQRAQRLGAVLEVASSSDGTTVSIVVPPSRDD